MHCKAHGILFRNMVNEDAAVRAKLRKYFEDQALVKSTVMKDKETEGIKFKDYFDFSEPVHKILIAPHPCDPSWIY